MLRTTFFTIAFFSLAIGCTPVRRLGTLTKTATLATAGLVTEGVLNGIFDSDETAHEQIDREDHERGWKHFWRSNPDMNPAMAEAYAND